jgi:hypothetical protein
MRSGALGAAMPCGGNGAVWAGLYAAVAAVVAVGLSPPASGLSPIVHEFDPFVASDPLFTDKPNPGTVVLKLGRII